MSYLIRATVLAFCFSPMVSFGQDCDGDKWYAQFSITNDTNDTINYSVCWGDEGWKSWSVKPGETMYHWYKYRYANQNRSPRPYVKFDADLTSGNYFEKRWATALATAHKKCDSCKEYVFQSQGNVLDILQL